MEKLNEAIRKKEEQIKKAEETLGKYKKQLQNYEKQREEKKIKGLLETIQEKGLNIEEAINIIEGEYNEKTE